MLPGSTPEDQEVEVCLVLNQWMVDEIVKFMRQRKKTEDSALNNFYWTQYCIYEQLVDEKKVKGDYIR